MSKLTPRERVMNAMLETFQHFTVYLRRSDPDLPPGDLENFILTGAVTKEEITAEWCRLLGRWTEWIDRGKSRV